MKKLLVKLTFVACVLLSSNSYAATTVTGEIKRIYPSGDRVYFRIKNDTCISGNQYYYFTLGESSNNEKYAAPNWYSMLLASAISKTPIRLSVNECSETGHIKVNYVYQDY